MQPGKPQQNAQVERFNRTVRFERPVHYLLDTCSEVREFASRWLWNCNYERLNMVLGGFTPKQRLPMAVYFLFLPAVQYGGMNE